MRCVVGAGLLALVVGACAAAEDLDRFSVVPEVPGEPRRDVFPPAIGISLARLLELDAEAEQSIGWIADAGLGVDGSVYLVDEDAGRVLVFDSLGVFVRSLGGAGSPGELAVPVQVAVLDAMVAVQDAETGRVLVYDTGGTFLRAFDLPDTAAVYLTRGPGETILVTRPAASPRLQLYDLRGRPVESFVQPPLIETELDGPYVPHPGLACSPSPVAVVYANPWTYELVSFGRGGGSVRWVQRVRSATLRPGPSADPAVGPVVQGAALAGLVCDSDGIVFAYVDLRTETLVYDFLTLRGEPLARLEFGDAFDDLFPGAPADLRGELLVTYTNHPFPRAFLYEILTRRQ